MKTVHVIGWILLVIGGLNWLLIGINPGWNVVGMLGDSVARVIYILVGISAVAALFTHKKDCKTCEAKPMQTM